MRTLTDPYLSYAPASAPISRPGALAYPTYPTLQPPEEKPSNPDTWMAVLETEMIAVYPAGGKGRKAKKDGKPAYYKVGTTRPQYVGLYHPTYPTYPLYTCICPACNKTVNYNKLMHRLNEPCPSCGERPRALATKGRKKGSINVLSRPMAERTGWYVCELALRKSNSLLEFMEDCAAEGNPIPENMSIYMFQKLEKKGKTRLHCVFEARGELDKELAAFLKDVPEPKQNLEEVAFKAPTHKGDYYKPDEEAFKASLKAIEDNPDFDQNIPF